MQEIFRIVTDGCGNMIALNEDGAELARVRIVLGGLSEELASRSAAVKLAKLAMEALEAQE